MCNSVVFINYIDKSVFNFKAYSVLFHIIIDEEKKS